MDRQTSKDDGPPYHYVLGMTGKDVYIQCLTCGRKSYNTNDIEQKYCGYCHTFHELWPGTEESDTFAGMEAETIDPEPSPGYCACGKPLHYSSAESKMLVDSMIKDLGEFSSVTYEGKTYLVPRHYIALHGLKGRDLPNLGFRLKE